jgi:succinyl-diaminopimelate desuccinylase
MDARLKVTQIKSKVSEKQNQRDTLRSLGLKRIGDSVVARAGGAGTPIALVGHLDTVPNWEAGGVERTPTRIIGRGAADMKGGVAVMLAVLQRLTADSHPTVCVFYDREEGPHADNGIHRVLAESRLLQPKPAMAIVLEPSSGTIHAGDCELHAGCPARSMTCRPCCALSTCSCCRRSTKESPTRSSRRWPPGCP